MIQAIEHLGLVDEGDLELDRAALELACLDHSDHYLSASLALLEEIAERVSRRADARDPTPQRAAALREVFATDYGFEGDREHYDDPANADLIQVLHRRRGLPVALGLLYVAIARRLGWIAHVLNTPGHALIALGPDPIVVLDPFDRGAIVAQSPAGATPGQSFASPLRLEELHPMTNRAVIVRLLMNQSSRAAQTGDFQRALVVMRRVTTTAPGYSAGWWEQARLELATGAPDAARLSLNSMLETTKDADTRRQVLDALRQLDV